MSKTKKRRKKREIPGALIAIGIIFIIGLALLFIHSENVKLNEEVRQLQTRLDDINSEIDSKEGQIMSGADLKAVETQARALGMTEAQPGQYVYESAARKETVISDSTVGLYDYLVFFSEARKEKLWPQEQLP